MSATVVEVLEKARARIERGWCQGHYGEYLDGETVANCAMGAICENGREEDFYARVEAIKLLEREVGVRSTGLVEWNDAGSRTKEEVLAAFDAAIARARGDVSDEAVVSGLTALLRGPAAPKAKC